MSYDRKSPYSKAKAIRALSNRYSNELLLLSLTKSSKKHRKSLEPILKKVATPGSAHQVTQLISSAEKQAPKKLLPEIALALISSCNLSQDDYQKIRNVTIAHNVHIFPTYHEILAAKKSVIRLTF